MSRLRIFTVCMTMFLLSIFTLEAQPSQPRPSMNDSEFTAFQIDMMVRQLHIEESKVEAFTALYTEYVNKMGAMQPKAPKREGQGGQGGQGGQQPERPKLTDEQIESQILNSFDLAEQSNSLKRDYYYKFKEVLTQQQILRMYNVERRLRERMLSESARRERD